MDKGLLQGLTRLLSLHFRMTFETLLLVKLLAHDQEIPRCASG